MTYLLIKSMDAIALFMDYFPLLSGLEMDEYWKADKKKKNC